MSRFGSTATLTPFDLAAMRYGVSGALTLPIFLRLVPLREWPRYAVLALFGGLGYGILVYSGFAFAPSAHAGVFVNGGIPFWTVVIVAALLAAGMYSYANQKIGACQASMMLALVPAFSAIGGWLILDEAPGIATMMGIVVVSLGALLGALPTGSMTRLRLLSPMKGK